MIQINLNGEYLDLGETNIRLEKVNSMFITDFYQGDWSFPFTVPLTDHNMRLLGLPNRIDLIGREINFVVDVYLFGMYYSSARLIVNAATLKTVSFNLAFGLRALNYTNTSLKDIDYGPDYFAGADTTSIAAFTKLAAIINDWTYYGFSFVPHYNPDFYGSANPTFNGMINRVNPTTGNMLYNTGGTGNKYCIVPFLFLFFVLNKIFKAEGLTPSGTFWDDPEAKTILLYNNYALDSPQTNYSSYLLTDTLVNYKQTNKIQFKKGPAGSFDNLGGWSNAGYQFVIQASHVGNCVVDIDMMVYIGNNLGYDGVYFVPEFELLINGVVFSTFAVPAAIPGTDQHVQVSIPVVIGAGNVGQTMYVQYKHPAHSGIASPYAHDVIGVKPGASLLLSNTSQMGLNLFETRVHFANHVKDITVGELLAEIKKLGVDIIFDFSNKTVTLNKIANYLSLPTLKDYTNQAASDYELSFETKNKGFTFSYDFGTGDKYLENNFKPLEGLVLKYTVRTFDQMPAPSKLGDLCYIENLNQYYIVTGTAGAYSWSFYSDNYYPVKVGDGETEIRAKLAPMLMGIHDNEGGSADQNMALVPHIKETGSSKMFSLGVNDFSLRMVFHRGTNKYNGLSASTTPTAKGGSHAIATSGKYGINGFQHGNYVLPPTQSGSFYETVLKPWLTLLNEGEILQRDLLLNEHDILTLQPNKQIVMDGTAFFIKNISVPIGKNLKLSRLKLLRM